MRNLKLKDLDADDVSLLNEERIKRIIKGEEFWFEVKHYHKNRNIIDLEVSCSMITIKKENFFVAFHRDITQRKQSELELIKAKNKAEAANRLKDAFIANISHEIRTPLNGILGLTSIIKDKYQDTILNEDEMLFDGITISSNRIIRTVDMILNYSRLHVGEFDINPKITDVSLICSNIVKEFITAAKSKSLLLSFRNNCGKAAIFADAYSISLAVSNLIDNAIKFTKTGSVNVILHKEQNENIILDIRDTGIGIDKKYLDFLFEPYRQEEMGYGRAYEGIGLGLAIVKKISDLNKYTISVISNKGEGTTFSINFGKGDNSSENDLKPCAVENKPHVNEGLTQKVILLVEDDMMNQLTIRKFLEGRYNILITDSSDEVKEILIKGNIDLILMDISIKGKLNGLELAKELKNSKIFSHIPIIAVTAHAFQADKINSLKAGCNGYLSKPFSRESLIELIQELVETVH